MIIVIKNYATYHLNVCSNKRVGRRLITCDMWKLFRADCFEFRTKHIGPDGVSCVKQCQSVPEDSVFRRSSNEARHIRWTCSFAPDVYLPWHKPPNFTQRCIKQVSITRNRSGSHWAIGTPSTYYVSVCLSIDSVQIDSDAADPTLIKDGLHYLQSGLWSTVTLFTVNCYIVMTNKVTCVEQSCSTKAIGLCSGGSCFESR
jgi:hypothetical protein